MTGGSARPGPLALSSSPQQHQPTPAAHLALPHHQSGISKNRPPIPQRGQLYFMSRIANGLCMVKSLVCTFLPPFKKQVTDQQGAFNTFYHCWWGIQSQCGFCWAHYKAQMLIPTLNKEYIPISWEEKQFVLSCICSASVPGNAFTCWNIIRTRTDIQ